MKDWKTKKGINAVEKLKKFQKIPDELKHSERLTILLTKQQRSVIVDYCKKNNLTQGDLIRDMIVEYFENRNISTTLEPEPDPRQTKMFEDEK